MYISSFIFHKHVKSKSCVVPWITFESNEAAVLNANAARPGGYLWVGGNAEFVMRNMLTHVI